MKAIKRMLMLPLVAMLAAACVVPAPAPTEKTIAEVLTSDTGDNPRGFDADWYDFDIVTQAVLLYPDLVEAASNPEASLTAFLPNDRAFQVLVADLTGVWFDSEKAVFDKVAGLGLPTVKTVLTYHLVGAKISAKDALASDGGELDTLQGGKLGVEVQAPALSLIRLNDIDTNDDDPHVVFSKFNYGGALANGYIHGISLVLRPSDLP